MHQFVDECAHASSLEFFSSRHFQFAFLFLPPALLQFSLVSSFSWMIPKHNFLYVLEQEVLYLYYLGFFYSFLLCSLLLVLSWIVHHPNSKFCGNSLPCWCRRSIFFSSVRLWVTLEIGAWNSTRYLIKHHYNLFSHIYIMDLLQSPLSFQFGIFFCRFPITSLVVLYLLQSS